MRRVVLVLATMALAILLASGVEQAVLNGESDRGPNVHPYVGALVTVPPSGEFKGQRIPVCSGTLISPRVYLTAGHCTDSLIKENLPTYVSFPDLQAESIQGHKGNAPHPSQILHPNS
jgi:V8-like Glu-specific endopeptidase